MHAKSLRVFWAALIALTAISCAKPDPAVERDNFLRRGDELVAAEEFGDAAAAFEKAVAADPRSGVARLKLATAYEQIGKWSQASNQAMRASDLLPTDASAKLLAARLILNQGRHDDSAAITADLLRNDPSNAAALVLFGTATAQLLNSSSALYALGDTGGSGEEYEKQVTDLRVRVPIDRDRAAEDALRRAIRIAPTSTDAKLALVNLFWATRRPEQGEELLRSLADEMPLHAIVNYAMGTYYFARNRPADGEPFVKRAASSGAPFDRGPLSFLADHYVDSNRLAEALVILEKLSGDDPQSDELSIRLAGVLERLGRHDEALARASVVLARVAKDPQALALKARILTATGKASEALPLARAAIVAGPAVSEAHLALADALRTTGNLEGAFASYVEALRLDPTATDLPSLLTRLGLAIGRDRAALDFARQAASREPENVEIAVLIVKALARVRDYRSANFALKPLAAKHPERSDVQTQLGVLLAAGGDAAGARAAFERALKLEPARIETLEGLVVLELGQHQIAAARQRVDRAVAASPDNSALLQLASRVARAEGDVQRAETSLRRALDLDPSNVTAALLLADGLSIRDRREDAIRILEDVLTRQPTSIPAQTALAMQLEAMGKTPEARERYRKIILDDPTAGTAAARLALIIVAQSADLDVALAVTTEAKRHSPLDPEVSDALGWVYLHKNLATLAILHLEDATRLGPRHALYHYHLGMAYARAGRVPKAREALERSLALDASAADRSKAQSALASLTK